MNGFDTFRKHLIEFSQRQYVSAALGSNLYGPISILFLWAGILLGTAIGELLPGDSAAMRAISATEINDKLLHFSAYAAIAFVPIFALRINIALICIIATEIVGIGLDVAQLFVRHRSYDPYDIVANTLGIVVGIMIAVASRSRVVRS